MSRPIRLGVLATHPIQYYSPLYRAIAAMPELDVTVYYAHRPSPEEQGHGFGVPFAWDVDLTSGYRHRWLANRAAPGAGEFARYDAPEIADEIARERFDVFLVMGWHARAYWQAMIACWRTGTPMLVRGDSQLEEDERAAKRLAKRLLYPRFVRRFAACLSVGVRSERYFRYYGARAVVRSPHFVDNAFFAARAEESGARRTELRARWDIPASAFACLFAGKLVPRKRPLDLIRSLAAAGDPRLHAVFAGDGELREACRAEAQRLGVGASFLGFMNQTEIASAYAAVDLLVLPSEHGETWGLVVNEGMACGLPAVVSEHVGCAPDMIIDGVTGHTYPTADVGRLSTVIATLAGDPATVAHMGRAARRHVAGFSVDAAAAGVVEAAQRVAGRVA